MEVEEEGVTTDKVTVAIDHLNHGDEVAIDHNTVLDQDHQTTDAVGTLETSVTRNTTTHMFRRAVAGEVGI